MTMDARHYEFNTAKADFYLCLANALTAPMTKPHAHAILGGDLTSDLADLDREIGYGLASQIAALQHELDRIGDDEDLLVLYAQLFLSPPRKVQLNAASYLDGSFNGGTVTELEQCYAENGVTRADSFHDLADHVSVQLEFISHLYRVAATGADAGSAISAGSFISRYPQRWISPLVEDVRRVGGELELAANPYLALMQILDAALESDAELRDGPLSATERREHALAIARQKRAERKVSAEEMNDIRKRLEEHGLSTEHLDPTRKDDPFGGWQAMVPPSPKR
jgi:TorA maturation chaperone TorD